MEDERAFYEYDMNTDQMFDWDANGENLEWKDSPRYGKMYVKGDFPNAGNVPRDFQDDKYRSDYQKMRKVQEILHMKQFDKAFKITPPPGREVNVNNPANKYWSSLDRNDNHPLEGPS